MLKTKIIFNGFLAKQLLTMGNPIIDLEKNHKLKNASVFIFEDTEKLKNDLVTLTAK